MPPLVLHRSCDTCRKRKTKCLPASDDAPLDAACANCVRLKLACEYTHVYRKPGRKSNKERESQLDTRSHSDSGASSPVLAKKADSASLLDSESTVSGSSQPTLLSRSSDGFSRSTGSSNTLHLNLEAMSEQRTNAPHGPSTSRGGLASPPISSSSAFVSPRPLLASHGHSQSQIQLLESSSILSGMTGSGPHGTASTPGGFVWSNFDLLDTAMRDMEEHQASAIPTGNLAPASGHPSVKQDTSAGHHSNILQLALNTHSRRQSLPGNDVLASMITPPEYQGSPGTGISPGAALPPPAMALPRPDGTTPGSGGVTFAHLIEGARPSTSTGPRGTGAHDSSAWQHPTFSPGAFAQDQGRSLSRGSGSTQNNSSTNHPFRPPGSGHSRGGPSLHGPTPAFYLALKSPDLQIEDVADWTTIAFFLSLYLKYHYHLSPIVHTPSFARALATRRDKYDRQFRAFILGVVTYTISESPIGRMQELCSRQSLEKISHNCHRASMLLHDRNYEKVELIHIGTLIYGFFFCQSNSYPAKASALLAEACQMVNTMKLHDERAADAFAPDFCELNLRRRVFWWLYMVDTTEASAGQPIHLNEHDGYPAFPLEVDDEYITTQGAFTQPGGRISSITGFVACAKLFKIIASCVVRKQRWGKQRPAIFRLDVEEALAWISQAEQEVNGIMDGLPACLAYGQAFHPGPDDDGVWYGMQRANLVITSLSARFLLYQFKTEVQPSNSAIAEERDALSREGIRKMASIPLEDLAANGESMRGKIFRILLALLDRPGTDAVWDDAMSVWWDMYTNIQFVQLVINKANLAIPTREPSPTEA